MPPACRFTRVRFTRPVLALVLLLTMAGTVRGAAPAYDALLPEYRDAYETRFSDQLIRYEIEIRFRPENNRITGTLRVVFPNFTGQPLDEIAFRLFPNALYYGEGYLAITEATVDGVAVEPAYEAERTAMFVPLPASLAPGDETEIALAFRTVIPDNSRGTYGIFSHHLASETWVLADWHPIVAGWDAERGWRVDPPTPAGDPTYADSATYDLTITLPGGFDVIGSGQTVSSTQVSDELARISLVTGPARDLTLVIANRLVPLEVHSGETIVRVWAEPDPAAQAAAAWVGELAAQTLAAYGARYGVYPYTELDLVSTPIQQSVLGVSWSGVIMLSDELFLKNREWIDGNPATARFAIVHEIGHQWWGAMIGANSNDHPFMVEGVTNALSLDIMADLFGAGSAVEMLQTQIAGRYRQALLNDGDGIVDQPVGSEGPGGPTRAALAYGKGALGFLAIRLAIGDEAYFRAFTECAARYLYANVEPAELLALFSEHAPGVDVAAIWRHWFEETGLTTAEIDAITAALTDLLYDEAIAA